MSDLLMQNLLQLWSWVFSWMLTEVVSNPVNQDLKKRPIEKNYI